MEIYKDKYRKVVFEKEDKILYLEWFDETLNMSEDEYKKASISIPAFAKEQVATRVLINAINSKFIVTPEIQDWVNKNTVQKYLEAGVQKVAILLPNELFTQISVEQLIDDSESQVKKQIQYFEDQNEARAWLNN